MVYCVAGNFLALDCSHDMNNNAPLVFSKPDASIQICNQFLFAPKNLPPASKIWGEPEIGVRIKRDVQNSVSDIEKYIDSVHLCNDITIDVETQDVHLLLGKGTKNSFQVSETELNVECLFEMPELRGLQNGVLLRSSAGYRYKMTPVEVFNYLSKMFGLRRGDMIIFGAPPRVRERLYLTAGDIYQCEAGELLKISVEIG